LVALPTNDARAAFNVDQTHKSIKTMIEGSQFLLASSCGDKGIADNI
jgi:hypothetical protein